VRHRLNRGGDRQLNRALHTVALSRLQHHPETRAYAARRTAEGKTGRDIKRCLKRAIAREIFRLLEAHAKAEKKTNRAA
jgi:transposase